MKIQKLYLILLSVVIIAGCAESGENKSQNKETFSEQVVYNKPFANPVLIYGSSFGNYFQALYKIGKFDEMLKFTSSESINKYGKNNILKAFKKMEFGYNIKLKSMNKIDSLTYSLNYETMIMSTKGIMRMEIKVENDTCKVVLAKLDGKNVFEE